MVSSFVLSLAGNSTNPFSAFFAYGLRRVSGSMWMMSTDKKLDLNRFYLFS